MAEGSSPELPMRVLAVYPWPSFWSMGEGRGAPSFFLSVTSFPRHGHEMHVLMPGPPGTPVEEDYHGVHLHRLITRVDFMPERGRSRVVQHVRILISYIVWRVRAARAGLALASRLRPDVVFGMGALGAPVGRAIARARGVPNVTRLFGTSLGEVLQHPLKRALRYPEIVAFRTPADAIIVCDDGSGGDEIARRFGVRADRLVFLSNGVDKGRFGRPPTREAARRDLNMPRDASVVLSVSRFHPEKRIDRLLDAAPHVLAERPDTVFVIVGEGEDGARLRAHAADLGIERSVVFTGSLPLEKLPAVYAAADVFVTVSDRTNILNPLHEAMMSGLPVIALNTGRTGSVVRDGENGVLIESSEPAGLGQEILDLLSNEAKRKALGAAARASADRRLPSIEERQASEVEVVLGAVRGTR